MTEVTPPGGLEGFFLQMRPRRVTGDTFTFETPGGGRRMFGGVTLGQALVAAAQTVPGLAPHELHTLFLRPHMPGSEARYVVERLRDGRRFSTRRVRAVEGERLLSESTVSFSAAPGTTNFQAQAPSAPAPEGLPLFAPDGPPPITPRPGSTGALVEQRLIRWTGPSDGGLNRLDLWYRPLGAVPDDPVLRAAALAAFSDLSSQLLGFEPDASPRPEAATMSHVIWFHALPSLDGWLLFPREASVMVGGRVLMTGALYTRDGRRCATLVQESVVAAG